MSRRPCSLTAALQCALVAGGLGGCACSAGEFKSQRDLHVVADATRGKVLPGVIFNHLTEAGGREEMTTCVPVHPVP